MSPIKINWLTIITAAVASFILEALWFTAFMNPWLVGVGRTREWFMSVPAVSPAVQYGTAFLCSVVAAIVLSILIQAIGPQTAKRGILLGALVWLGFVATSWAKEYIFEVRTLQIFAINTGSPLLELMLTGAIVGAWKNKPRASTLP